MQPPDRPTPTPKPQPKPPPRPVGPTTQNLLEAEARINKALDIALADPRNANNPQMLAFLHHSKETLLNFVKALLHITQ